MRVIDEDDPKHRQRIEHLTFWGCLEAIIRVAQRKAMPTDGDIEAMRKRGHRYKDAGDYLVRLREEEPAAYVDFLSANKRSWHETTRQPIHSKLSILLCLTMRTLERNLQRWENDGSAEWAWLAAREEGAAIRTMLVSRGGSELLPPQRVLEPHRRGSLEPRLEDSHGDGILTLTKRAIASLSGAIDEQTLIQDHAARRVQRIFHRHKLIQYLRKRYHLR